MIIPQGIRRQRILCLRALASGDETGDALLGGGSLGNGAELAGPGRAAAALRHRAQKTYYLPRLARGEEIPCFALTNAYAGSDAAAIPDVGVVCRGMHEGRETLACA